MLYSRLSACVSPIRESLRMRWLDAQCVKYRSCDVFFVINNLKNVNTLRSLRRAGRPRPTSPDTRLSVMSEAFRLVSYGK